MASERVNKLYAVVEENAEELLSVYNGKTVEVIPENYKDGKAVGHTASFIEVEIECAPDEFEAIQGKLVSVELAVCKNLVSGKIV